MKKSSKSRTPRQRQDAQLEEFETQDLGKDIRTSGVRPVIVQPKTRPTSILLDVELIQQLRVQGSQARDRLSDHVEDDRAGTSSRILRQRVVV